MIILSSTMSMYWGLLSAVTFNLLIYGGQTASSAVSNGVTEENNLLQFLQERIPKYTHPLDMLNRTVYMYIDLYQIVDVDEKNGVLKAKFWLFYYYYSKLAQWEPENYGNITVAQFPAKTFWTPSIVVIDAIEINYQSFRDQLVMATGLVGAWSSLLTVEVSCSFDVTYFPYDTQYCPVNFGPWGVNNGDYRLGFDALIGFNGIADLLYYSDNDQWDLQRPLTMNVNQRDWRNMQEFDQVTVEIRLKRLPEFYSRLLVSQIIILDILSPLTFLLPVESGEKVSLAITIMLAEIVTFATITDILPASSRNFPILGYFVLMVVMQVALSCILTVAVLSVNYLGGRKKMGCRLRRLICSKGMYMFGMSPYPRDKALLSNITPEKPKTTKTHDSIQKQTANVSKWAFIPNISSPKSGSVNEPESPMGAVGKLECIMKEAVELQNEENTVLLWSYFATFLDRLFFYLYCSMAAFVLIYFAVQYSNT